VTLPLYIERGVTVPLVNPRFGTGAGQAGQTRKELPLERLAVTRAPAAGVDAMRNPFGQHYTLAHLAELWCLDESTIRRMFQDEPGVLKIGRSGRRD
jgi:transcriptional regulator GlxA family with amidase domain